MNRCLIFFLVFWMLPHKQADAQLSFPHTTLTHADASTISSFLYSYYPDLQTPDITLQVVMQKRTATAMHFRYEVLYQQLPLWQSCIQVNLSRTGTVLSVKRETPDLSFLLILDPVTEILAWQQQDIKTLAAKYWPATWAINEKQFVIALQESQPAVMICLHSFDTHHDNTLVLKQDGTLFTAFDNLRHANIDTMAQVKVFRPDPLTPLNQVYGGIYIDNNDANAPWMNAEYWMDSIRVRYDTGTGLFYPENELVKIDDIESPTAAPVTPAVPAFLYDRSQSGFEDINALYHITRFHDYISSLGYDSLMNLQVVVDTHAQFGADNSVFNRNGGNPTICYGTGGVDDAEDADVIIHEYCHGVSWSANNNGNFSTERSALDEGLADYFATSYSRSINVNRWADMFTWDGHNEYWSGRTAATTNMYPYSGNIWAVGEIWNTAMSTAWTSLGPVVTDKLMLEALHFFTDSTTLPEAAYYVMQADTLLFAGIHATALCTAFQSKNLFDANCRPVGFPELQTLTGWQVFNSAGFAHNQGDAVIRFAEPFTGRCIITDLSGRVWQRFSCEHLSEWHFSPSGFPAGICQVQFIAGDKMIHFPLLHIEGK